MPEQNAVLSIRIENTEFFKVKPYNLLLLGYGSELVKINF